MMIKLRRPATGLLQSIILSFANPVILVSALGPTIVLNVFIRLYHFDKVKNALEQPIVHALLELQSQAYVHILAIALLLISYTGSLVSTAMRSHENFVFVKNQFGSPLHLLVLVVVLLTFALGLYIWIGPPTSNLELLGSYACPLLTNDGRCANINAPVGLPPSNIVTYGRFAVTYSALLTIHIPITTRESKAKWNVFFGITGFVIIAAIIHAIIK